ncbi:MAG: TIGR03986 family CRISPR-associated RAMP protein [Deltaproteobacteria bacterium]|nr:TIGR03986 family CRISPR-associated RAMP protein [Deltaproteobacteria bacterium]
MPEPKYKSRYRFVPLNSRVVPGPLAYGDISHGRPLPGCWSGSLTVEWKNETPICVGVPKKIGDETVDSPFCLPGERYALPGSSLKGMIRSVLEIATFSHLGQINDHHHFGYRDFDDVGHYQKHIIPGEMKAGWLRYNIDKKCWQFAIASGKRGFALLLIEKLTGYLEKDIAAWKSLKTSPKYALIRNYHLGPRVISYTPDAEQISGVNVVSQFFSNTNAGDKLGIIVCANGIKNGNQKYEAIFHQPANFRELSSSYLKQFALLHSQMTKNTMEPEGNWKDWLDRMKYPDPLKKNGQAKVSNKGYEFPGIPVYYCGKPPVDGREDAQGFYMGFSRVIKIPYGYSVGQVAARTLEKDGEAYSIPKLQEELDFARAMFGDVEGSLPSDHKKKENDPDRKALKGRVAFEFAARKEDQPPAMGEVFRTVMMGPKASFWPFYLKDGKRLCYTADYNDPDAILAGRKRYPVHCKAEKLAPPHDNAKKEQITQVQFLDEGNTFQGQIRFHNLHPVELGALLWSLTFGEFRESPKYFHAMGRAKGNGYGRLAARITGFSASAPGPETPSADLDDMESFVEGFTVYMDEQLASLGYEFTFKESPAVLALRALANPENKNKNKDRHGVMNLKKEKENEFRKLKTREETEGQDKRETARDMLCDYVLSVDWAEMRP